MKTLIIHPKDSSTDFLSEIYKDQDKDCLIVNQDIPKATLHSLVKYHDRVIMLGHGTPFGLLGYGRHIIDASFVDVLKHQHNNVHVWCFANEFMEKHDLKGFGTGMIISEIGEAFANGIIKFKYEDVNTSNKLFALLLKEELFQKQNVRNSKLIEEIVKKNFISGEYNPIIEFNQRNIFSY